jgi:hypothetical protein
MHCLDRISTSSSIVALALALAGCSDDGLAPEGDTQGSTGVATALGESTAAASSETNPQTTAADSIGPTDSTGPVTDSTGPADSSDGGTTSEPPPSMTCENAMQCVLVDDCCQCAAHHVDDVIPECDVKCDQPMCAALGIPDIGVACEDGMCGLEKHDCSGVVACDSLPPDCVDGTLPEVGQGGGGCWTGACIPVEACDPVPGCEHCDDTEVCVATETIQATTYSCRPLPDECAREATCECMPPDTCAAPFDTCADMDGQITCS